jgi:hypothetical protein
MRFECLMKFPHFATKPNDFEVSQVLLGFELVAIVSSDYFG